MSVERRFQLGYGEEPTDDPGLVLGEDGTIVVVDGAGSRSTLGGVAPVVNIALGGDGPDTFDMAPDKTSIVAGPATFLIHNVGGSVHECLIFQTADTAADVIAAAPQGGTIDESSYVVVADSGDVPAGHWTRFDLLLAPGHYVLVCNEAGHAHAGMAADLDVVLLAGATEDSVTR